MRLLPSLAVLSLLALACVNGSANLRCPPFPSPEPGVIDAIPSDAGGKVDRWLIALDALADMLDDCS